MLLALVLWSCYVLVIVDKSAFSPFFNVSWLCCPICAFFGTAGTYADSTFFWEGRCICWLQCWTSLDDSSSSSMRGWPASRLLHNPGFRKVSPSLRKSKSYEHKSSKKSIKCKKTYISTVFLCIVASYTRELDRGADIRGYHN